MPIFNSPHNAEMVELFKSHTNKTVVPVRADGVADLGGSVRCLSWQVKTGNKAKILKLAKK
jgi:agmatine/peptidylarginine deiminase